VNAHKNIGKQLPNGDILFIGVTADNQIRFSTWSYHLDSMRANGILAPETSYYWGYDINGGIAYIFYYNNSLNIYYRTTTDGINWSPEQLYDIIWPEPYDSNYVFWRQAAVTDNGEPKLIFDNLDLHDYHTGTYPYLGKVYVSPGSGQPCRELSVGRVRNFYPTISAGGDYLVGLWHSPVTNDIDSLTFWNLFYSYSTDNGITWNGPFNITSDFPYRHGLAQISKRLDPATGKFFFVFGQDIDLDHDPIWICWRDPSGLDHMRWYLGRRPIIPGIEECNIDKIQTLKLTVAPNPGMEHLSVFYTLPNSGYIHLKLFSGDGRLVREIESGYRSAGNYIAIINPDGLTSGAYFLVLEMENETICSSVVIIH
ncbi:MAG: hypothetical protein ABIL14_05520, partial [candidate division WOR-3 bacterium]